MVKREQLELKFGDRGSGFKVKGAPQDFYKLKEECLQKDILFEDSQFPADATSLYSNLNYSRQFEWRRPKQIVANPQFEEDGYSRFDIKQGELGDCWLLAAIANLTLHPNILHKVVPLDQSMTHKYAGIFHFKFWQYGRWIDVVIDDRLPVKNGKLRFLTSTSKNEFWPSLLEKAYAKLHGKYEALECGNSMDALIDFTGGIPELFRVKQTKQNIYNIMLKGFERNSLMSISADQGADERETVTAEGIVKGHAYSVTDIKICKINSPKGSKNVNLIRLRNPWGNNVEWNGPFSDKSPEWQQISVATRKEMGLVFDEDGEFWMEYSDFCKQFDELEICNLRPDSFSQEELQKGNKKMWKMNSFEGEWVKGLTAGGCRNFINTFCNNPQYRIQLSLADEGDARKLCTLMILLIQKDRRAIKAGGMNNLEIGISVYSLKNIDNLPTPLPLQFFKTNKDLNKADYLNLRQITHRFKLPPGHYCVIPSTYSPNEEAEFVLQVFTEKQCDMFENDEEVSIEEEKDIPTSSSVEDTKQAREFFLQIAGEDKEVDWLELKEVLDKTMKFGLGKEGFSKDICRSMVSMVDVDFSGKLSFEEFDKLWKDINKWKEVFKTYAKGKVIIGYNLRKALNFIGYKLNNHILNILVHRYGNKDGNITLDDFIMCTVKLKTMFDLFKLKDLDHNDKAIYSLQEWLVTTMYS